MRNTKLSPSLGYTRIVKMPKGNAYPGMEARYISRTGIIVNRMR